MRFLQKDKFKKTILVISDLHLGAGAFFDGKRNPLEDFYHDKELVDFLDFYSDGEYQNREMELIINGDFLDFLAVPYVRYFDDEYWSEEASLERLKLIVTGHSEVFNALSLFLSNKKRKIIYIIGNHDAELILDRVKENFLGLFAETIRENIKIIANDNGDYSPEIGLFVIHGHEYEHAHFFHSKRSIVEDETGRKYFRPSWGAYYITRVLNKFKEEKGHINAIKPIGQLFINGVIYEPLFTIRFFFASVWYFIMVRFIYFYRQHKNVKKIWEHAKRELSLFKDYEQVTEDFFENKTMIKALLVGHTHIPLFRPRPDGSVFVNTGTWTKTFHLDFGTSVGGTKLTYAQIDIPQNIENYNYQISLNNWNGRHHLPYTEY